MTKKKHSASAASKKPKSLYTRLGGEPALSAVVDAFYAKVLADQSLNAFFNETNMEGMKKMQLKFLSYAFGGPVKWDGKSLSAAHIKARAQGLKSEHFDSVAGHLLVTLQEFKVPQKEIDEVMNIAGSVRGDIVNQTLFERLGGEPALNAVVESFYAKVLSDDTLKTFFNETNMDGMKKMQLKFLSYAFGGPMKWDGKNLSDAHKKARSQGLKPEHFDSVASHLLCTLKEFKVPQKEIDEVMNIAGSVKSEIVDPTEEEMRPLFERLGGETALSAVVDSFYDKVMSDPMLKDFFNETNMEGMKKMQTKFLSYAFGGPVKWEGRSLSAAHEKARQEGLKEEHFNAVAGHLLATLKQFNVPQREIEQVMTIAGSVKDDIVSPFKHDFELTD